MNLKNAIESLRTELRKFSTQKQSFADYKLVDGTVVRVDGDLVAGTAVYVVAEEGTLPAPDGSWFGSFKVENDEVWDNRNLFRGFSVEGLFGMDKTESELEVALAGLADELTAFLQQLTPTYKSH